MSHACRPGSHHGRTHMGPGHCGTALHRSPLQESFGEGGPPQVPGAGETEADTPLGPGGCSSRGHGQVPPPSH